MKAQIITIGDEILIGQIVDTNSAWIATELTKLGFQVQTMLSVSDEAHEIELAVETALQSVNLIIVTGGLGPTKDDITKTTLSRLFQMPLAFKQEVYDDVVSFIERRGGKMNPLNRDQALFPEGAKWLKNRQGTAPGMWFETSGSVVISLPGVPSEMKGIMMDEVIPALKNHFPLPSTIYQTLMLTGIAESHLALKIEDWENNLPKGMKLAYLPSPGIIRLRLGFTSDNPAKAQEIIQQEIEKVKPIIVKFLFSETEQSLELTLVNLLKNNAKTISIAESCTGGNLSHLITSIPGSSSVFKGSVVAYSNEIKTRVLGVDSVVLDTYGAVSGQVVEQMAQGTLRLMESDFSIATSGIAGPDGGSVEKPVGMVWIAIATKNQVLSKKFQFGTERSINITRSSLAALNWLREVLLHETFPDN
jgi:nicotinamide-nucleotide amidase